MESTHCSISCVDSRSAAKHLYAYSVLTHEEIEELRGGGGTRANSGIPHLAELVLVRLTAIRTTNAA